MKLTTFLLELLRMCLLFILGTTIAYGMERIVFTTFFNLEIDGWYTTLGNFILLFVLYRNYFQFRGWYKSALNVKLKRNTTIFLVAASAVCILGVPILTLIRLG
ncbi:hypothetical protein VK70_14255 [Paenibacillus durus ATCC 35681]|uniref:Uncharacterized protein n=2 Tax=Paenibacillus durus TaxID=44251 RepID=A0A0F7FFG6_PAEDU|nr:hypothetical protein VK70_14255 [Paenibacillus durus ATCC 35681]